MIRKTIITGTESTGKTELTVALAAHYKTVFAPDCSRLYIEKIKRDYNQNDVLEIAIMIIEEENKLLEKANEILVSDNDLINIKIWLQYYKWQVPDWLETEIVKRKDNLYLLCDIDIAWIPDGQRKNRDDRKELFEQFKQQLNSIGAAYKIISGENGKRTGNAIDAIDEFLSSSK